MSRFESVFCRGVGWRAFAGRVALPLALQGDRLEGEVLEIGGGSGAMAARLLATHPTRRITVTDYDEVMVAAARTRLAPFADRASCNKPTPRGCRRCPQWEHPRGDGSAHPGGPAGRAVVNTRRVIASPSRCWQPGTCVGRSRRPVVTVAGVA
jgi:hypothetical protein